MKHHTFITSDLTSAPRHATAESTSDLSEKLGSLPEWKLTDLYPDIDSEELKTDLAKARETAQNFQEACQGKLEAIARQTDTPENFLKVMQEYERIQDLLGKLGSYAYLLHATASNSPKNKKFFGDMQEQLTSISSSLLFFALELNRIPDETVSTILKSEDLKHYQPWFENLRKEKPFQLDDKTEKLFNEKSVTGPMAWKRLFSETINNLEFEIQGKKQSIEPTLNLLLDAKEEKRKAAAKTLANVFENNIQTFTLITNTLIKDKEISDRWRSFEDVADDRHLSNRVEREVVDALEKTVREKYPDISHRYYALKAKWLGKDKLAYWDRNAPISSDDHNVINWDEAQSIVLSSYGLFSEDIASIVKKFFDNNWIDAPVKPGKQPGAFAHPTVPSAHPFIMLNYLGSPRDVMTLAHELGHGVHQYLANEQGPLLCRTPLTLAETASVFGEMLTFQSLLKKETDPLKKKYLIASKVEDMINTVVRQIAFYSFEREIHIARRKGELTSEQIGEIWMNIQKESLGPSVELYDEYRHFWCYIPHFIRTPFYVYAYAFGECLVNSLYAKYEQSHAGFQEKYADMLKAGGSKNHIELLAPFDLNASDPDFWKMGLSVIENLIDQLEKYEEA